MPEQLAETIPEPTEQPGGTGSELDAWIQAAHLILAAVSDCAVHDGQTDLDVFRQRIQQHLMTLKNHPTPVQVLTAAGSLSQAIANQSEQNQRRIDALLAELQDLRGQIASAPVASAPESVDACTGLPNRSQAEAAIGRAVAASAQPTYVAVFYLHRMNLANARFGAAIGDQIISFCGQHLTAALIKPDDALYRWSGPAFVAVLRKESHPRISDEVQRAASSPVSRFFETASRTVYLPIKLSGGAIVVDDRTYREVTQQIERFVLEAAGLTGAS
jgi:GGDEF domain-containing protein